MESSTFILSETNSAFALNVAVILAIAAVAYTDYLVDTHINLGYLYLLPLALSGLIHRLKVSMGLIAICTVLHDWFGPYEHGGWEILVRNILLIASFSTVVVGLNRLNKQRVWCSAFSRTPSSPQNRYTSNGAMSW